MVGRWRALLGSSVQCPDSRRPLRPTRTCPCRPAQKESLIKKGPLRKRAKLTSLRSPTSNFDSEPEPFVSAGGPELAGVHGDEILPVST